MSIKEKLAKRLNEEFDLDVNPEDFQRTYAGRNLKSQGAFVWLFNDTKHTLIVGGCEPASKYIIKKNILVASDTDFNEIEIYAYAPDEPGYSKYKK